MSNVIDLSKRRTEEERLKKLEKKADAVENLIQAFKLNKTRLEEERKKANESVKRSYRLKKN